MDFSFRFQHECPLGRIVWVGESSGAQIPSMRAMRELGHYGVVYLFQGHGFYQDARGTKRELADGDCFLLFPDIPHHYGPSRRPDDWCEFYIVFDGPVFDLWRQRGLLRPENAFFRLEPVYMWLKRFREVVDHRAANSPEGVLADLSRLQMLLSDILTHEHRTRMGEDELAWLHRAYALIEETIPNRPNYRTIARKLGVSYDVFRRRFARLSGRSPSQYHLVSLMDRACGLLYKTRMTHAEIAAQLGLCDAFHFSRKFKQVTGLSPRQFRVRFLREA